MESSKGQGITFGDIKDHHCVPVVEGKSGRRDYRLYCSNVVLAKDVRMNILIRCANAKQWLVMDME